MAQLIEDESRMVSYAVSHLRDKASKWAYSALMADVKEFPSWAIFNIEIRAKYQPPNNEVLLQAHFFGERQAKRSLQVNVQEMRSLLFSITVGPIPEHIKVPRFYDADYGMAHRDRPFLERLRRRRKRQPKLP